MTALLIVLGVIAGILLLLCIPVVFHVEYKDSFWAQARWLFVRRQLVPGKPEKPKKAKPKKEKPAKEKEKEDPEKASEKKRSIFLRFYDYQGLKGYIRLLQNTVAALKKFRHGLWLGICVRRFHLAVHLSGGDPYALAERYGKTSAAIFPALGWLSARVRSKKGRVRAQITPDFTGQSEREIACAATISIIPLVLIGAALGLLVRLGWNVALKFLRGAKAPKKSPQGGINKTEEKAS